MLNKSINKENLKQFLIDIDEFLECHNEQDIKLIGVSTISNSKENTLVWIRDNCLPLSEYNFKAIIVPEDFNDATLTQMIIKVKNPRRAFSKVVEEFFSNKIKRVISKDTKIGKTTFIGNNAAIGEYTTIGENCILGNNVQIEKNVTIYDNVIIGDNVLIESGTVIGSNGFGIIKDENGNLQRFPHIGNVIINDNVEIGSNCCIDRGTIDSTTIGQGTKIDNLVHIAHNVQIGTNCIITAKSEISGSVKVGNNVWISPSTTIIDSINIGNNVFIAIGTVVTKDIPDNKKAIGYPMKLREQD